MLLQIKNKYPSMIFLMVIIFTLSGCTSPDSGWSDNQMTIMNTSSEIRVLYQDRSLGSDAISEAFERMLEIESAFFTHHAPSQISRINASAGISPVSVDDEVRFLVEEGLRHYELSGGLFHIGLGNLTALWGLNSEQPHIPDADAIATTLATAKIESVQLTGNEIMMLDRESSLDLDELAKGYALDEAARVLRDLGIVSGLITLGDDVYVLGEKPGGDSWHVWIKKPFAPNHEMLGYLEVINLAVITTGNDTSVNFIDNDAEYYHQVIDPRTGRLVSNDLASVTVVTDTGLDGSVYSMTAFIMGLDEGYRYLLEAPGLEGLFITKDNIIYTTPGLTEMFQLIDEENYTMEIMVIEDEADNDQ